MARLLVIPIFVGLLVAAACGGDERRTRPLTVAEVLERPALLGEAPAEGRAFPVGRTQFVLAGPERSIFVLAGPDLVRRIRRPGQRVIVRGSVERLEQDQAVELADEIAQLSRARGPDAAARRPPEVLRARRTQGAPYIELRGVDAPAGER
jgi:hypothetical protein